MNQKIYTAFICLSVLLAIIYVGIIYWKRQGTLFGENLGWTQFFLYLGTPAAILTLLITLYEMYRPMRHFPPLFIFVMYAMLGIFYILMIAYYGYLRILSIPSCVLWCSLVAVVIISIFVYTPSMYDTNIDEVENKFVKDRIYQPEELSKLRKELVDTFSAKNKYYIQWFIALVYVPIVIHYIYKCQLNPVAYMYLYNYLINVLNLKGQDMEPSLIPQSNNMLETLKELDKNITYTSTEKKLIEKIREAIVNKTDDKLVFTQEEQIVLRKIRKYLERNEMYFHNKSAISSVYEAVTKLFSGNKASVQEHGLYAVNILVIMIVMIYVFVYENTTQALIIPLFTVFLSLSIFYLNG